MNTRTCDSGKNFLTIYSTLDESYEIDNYYLQDGFTPFITVKTEQTPSNITIKLYVSNELPKQLENYMNLYWEFIIRLHETEDSIPMSGFNTYSIFLNPGEISLNANREYVFVSPTLEVNERGKFFDIYLYLADTQWNTYYNFQNNHQRHIV